MAAGDRVRAVIEPLLDAHGLELVDVEQSGAVLRVTVDRAEDGGIDLDTVARASELVSAALDRDDPIPGRYTLEVSSPGVERTLRTPAHFRRCLGETVAVKTRPGTEGERRVEGVLEAAGDTGITVGGRVLAYDDIERARTVFVWGSGAADAKRPRKKAASR
jgi:ribosome maturation factor RimP